jgi:hypothetical protein
LNLVGVKLRQAFLCLNLGENDCPHKNHSANQSDWEELEFAVQPRCGGAVCIGLILEIIPKIH